MTMSRGNPLRFPARAATALVVAAGVLALSAADSSAQILRRGLQGGAVGAVIGAITGGGKGAAKGAAIGGIVGGVVGAAERSHAAPPPPPPRPVYAAPPPPPRAAVVPPPPPRDPLVHDVQVSLTKLGYAPGLVDGQYGRRTRQAISAYQHDNELPVTGKPSPALLDHLRSRGG